MNVLQEILTKLLENEKTTVTFPNLNFNAAELVEQQCLQALQKIKAVISDNSLDDFACVENIVQILDAMGSGGGARHDFG